MAVNAEEVVLSGDRLETSLSTLLAEVVRVDAVSADSHFFRDLGANSLLMAQFCARVRKHPDLPSVSMKDIYRHPTIKSLTTALADVSVTPAETRALAPVPATEDTRRTSTRAYILCGVLQAAIFLAYSMLAALVAERGYAWISTGGDLLHIYLRAVVVGSAGLTGMCVLPILAKWILIGRWKPREIRAWSPAYLRFWTVKALLHANPIILFVGNPLYVLYLRALGARIGKRVTILSKHVPVCTDLLEIGSDTVIRKDSFFLGYRAHEGTLQTGRVTLGREAFVGEHTVLDIDTSIGDGAQLGHSSSLHRGGAVPNGQRWHGSPAQPTEVDYIRVEPSPDRPMRRIMYGFLSLVRVCFVFVPLSVGGVYMLLAGVPEMGTVLGPEQENLLTPRPYLVAVILSSALFAAFVLVGLVAVAVLPRLMNLALRPGKAYPLYGVHYSLHRTIARFSNSRFFVWLFGDSSYIVHYLRGIGYNLSHVEQTGSNFGSAVQHETPFLSSVGRGTMVADGLSFMNAEYSSTSFRLLPTSIGAHNFLGNQVFYPAGGRTGDNCLLATKVMVPLDGPVREDVGLLGSPSFEIPRTVERDTSFDHLRTGEEFRRRLSAKNRYNVRTMGVGLFIRWLHILILTVLSFVVTNLSGGHAELLVAAFLSLTLVVTALYHVLVERVLLKFGRLRPRLCSIYQPYFWWHERFWKVPDTYLDFFNGTPFKSLVWRMLGVRVGRRLLDDGCFITERTLTTIGDDCTLNAGSKIQCHSQEDGTFKSDHVTIGSRCTLGVGSLTHYGVTMHDDVILAPDSFLMKGEEVPQHARWGGNPATEMRDALTCQPA
ncbi:Pls/PosA family non-ribosomal peptide synthetase [Saccharomonospora cyanea]|uniref:Non-ribosomal peptide synthetase domain-containing protein n=1 Tax=Saccharomonospora cyanea NA-134 TaxID=882082 RepID=H5XLZ7_9PSEU|nr:Pls/PosA family non-ribosomal peptide synthetase [Saccharomonospora cyanea]EHR62039.1 non-ribosomal peptide synthetase domain-containing protein [Saccharomonospora cyanea NA-134]